MLSIFKPAPHKARLPAAEIDPTYRRLRWQIFLGIFFGYAAYYLVRKNFALAMPYLVEQGFSRGDLGFALSGISIAYGFSKFIMGSVSDRSNPRVFLPAGLILAAAVMLFMGFVPWATSSIAVMFVLLFLCGWFQGMGWPPCGRTMVHWWSQKERGGIVSVWNCAHNVGGGIPPLLFLLGSTVLNVALDLLFILVFDMGVAGAGWATVLAQLISGIACLVYMIKRFDILHLSRKDLKPDAYSMSRLCAMGVPMGLQYSITAIGSILLQSAVNSLGETYMAAVTAGSKVTQFLCCPFDAMGSTMATYCGQNVGAGRVDRIESGVKKCSMLGIAYAIIALIVIIPFGGEFSKLFIDGTQTEILDLAKQFLWLNVLFYIPLAFVNIIRFSIQGLGNSQLAVFAGVFEMIARGGVALGLVPAFGYVAVCLASPAAWVLADLFLFPAFFHSVKILKNRFPSSSATAEKNDTES